MQPLPCTNLFCCYGRNFVVYLSESDPFIFSDRSGRMPFVLYDRLDVSCYPVFGRFH